MRTLIVIKNISLYIISVVVVSVLLNIEQIESNHKPSNMVMGLISTSLVFYFTTKMMIDLKKIRRIKK